MVKSKIDKTIGNILIVDDIPENFLLLAKFLEIKGHHVRAAKTGMECLSLVKAKQPDLILLDIMLPDLEGYDVCKILKADKATMEIPVIFLSALNTTGDKLKGFEVGGVDYITKPFRHEEVLSRVEAHLNLKFLRSNLEYQVEKLKWWNKLMMDREIVITELKKEVNDLLKKLGEKEKYIFNEKGEEAVASKKK